jgi:transposase
LQPLGHARHGALGVLVELARLRLHQRPEPLLELFRRRLTHCLQTRAVLINPSRHLFDFCQRALRQRCFLAQRRSQRAQRAFGFGRGLLKRLPQRRCARYQFLLERLRRRARVKTNIKRKEEVRKSLTHCLTRDHCYVIAELLKQHDELKAKIEDVERELAQKVAPYAHLIDKLKEIPGLDQISAMGILTETTADMSHFKDERRFAAWAGVAPGNHESAGKKKDLKPDEVTLT